MLAWYDAPPAMSTQPIIQGVPDVFALDVMYARSSGQVALGAIVILSEAKDPWPRAARTDATTSILVYIMANVARKLYVGVRGDVYRRVTQHKAGSGSGFTSKYHLDRWFTQRRPKR